MNRLLKVFKVYTEIKEAHEKAKEVEKDIELLKTLNGEGAWFLLNSNDKGTGCHDKSQGGV